MEHKHKDKGHVEKLIDMSHGKSSKELKRRTGATIDKSSEILEGVDEDKELK